MNTLNAAIRDFLVGDTDYRAFRRACSPHIDGPEERLWNRVESACAEFENFPKEVSERDLRRELLDILIAYFMPATFQQSYTTNAGGVTAIQMHG